MDASTGASKVAGSPKCQLPTGRVRIVGWIRPFRGKEVAKLSQSSSSHERGPALEQPQRWISVLNPERESGTHAVVTLGGRQEEAASASGRLENYMLDWCYEQEEGISEIFTREVAPLLERFSRGLNVSIFAYGARDSGKTQLIEGSDEKPGLAFFTINEILAYGERNGKEVMMSCYEVHQDHVFDILNPKVHEVQILEDATGKVQLKGLSQVPVKTVEDFKRLYHGCHQQMPVKKETNQTAFRRHRGLIIYMPCICDVTDSSFIARLNIIDLAGYEDTKLKKSGPCFTEISKINRSLYALQNVVSALNANDGHIPYRDSKLTHLLKDFISRESQALMITCLKPIPCTDTVQVVTISSRSCLSANNSHLKLVRKKSGQRAIPCPSPVSDQRPNRLPSGRDTTFSRVKSGIPRSGRTPNKARILQSPPMARKLFNMPAPANHSISSVEDKHVPTLAIDAGIARGSAESEGKDNLASLLDIYESSYQESCAINDESCTQDADEVSQDVKSNIPKDFSMENEHISSDVGTGSSPLISERLREISNSLKLLSCQPLSTTPSHERDLSFTKQDGADNIEPRTPVRPLKFPVGSMCDGKTTTPKERFTTHGTGLKDSLVEECLMFLNRASEEELKGLKGIGEKRLRYILELREEEPEPFKELNDLQQIGLTPKQAKGLVRNVVAGFFDM